MFERYTEKSATRDFFARYEASQYGSPYTEPEHLLLGLAREDPVLEKRFLGPETGIEKIRAEIERHITRREPISTSVEVPLTADSKRILNFAAEEAANLGQWHVGTEQLLLGILRAEGSLAAEILRTRGLRPAAVRSQLPKGPNPTTLKARPNPHALLKLDDFLAGLKWHKAEDLLPIFAANAQFVDVCGRRLNREEIEREFVTLFCGLRQEKCNTHHRTNHRGLERRGDGDCSVEKRHPCQRGTCVDPSDECCACSPGR